MSRLPFVASLAVLTAFFMGTVTTAAHAAPTPDRTIAIGDSVMLGARWALQKQGITTVDAAKSRQAAAGAARVRARGAALPRNVVVHLGTNGTFPEQTCTDLLRAVGPDRRLFLLTISVPRKWESANNARIRACADQHPGRVVLVDWNRAAKEHPRWLYADHIHLRPEGARGYARLISQAVENAR